MIAEHGGPTAATTIGAPTEAAEAAKAAVVATWQAKVDKMVEKLLSEAFNAQEKDLDKRRQSCVAFAQGVLGSKEDLKKEIEGELEKARVLTQAKEAEELLSAHTAFQARA